MSLVNRPSCLTILPWGGGESATAGKWFYVALARTAAESPSRRRVRGEAEEESKGGGGDGDDDDDDDDMEL